MKQSEFNDFVDILQLVAEQYGKNPSEGLIALYWQGLKQYDFTTVRDAIGRHLGNTDTGQFMPKIADIIKMMNGSTMDQALSAWAKVDRAMRCVGPYETVVFDDAIIHAVLHDMGGWVGFSTKSDDEWPFVAKEFENRYRGYKSRGDYPAYPPTLVGIFEAHNAQKNFKVDPPVLIGNVDLAKKVMIGGTTKQTICISKLKNDLDIPQIKQETG